MNYDKPEEQYVNLQIQLQYYKAILARKQNRQALQ